MNIERQTLAEVCDQRTHQLLQLGMGMDIDVSGTTLGVQRGDEPHQPEAMVAMEMGDEDMVQAGDTHPKAAHLMLSTLPTIDHKDLLPQGKHLGRMGKLLRRHRRTCP